MKDKALSSYLFTFVCDIEPAKNIDDTIKEFYPEKNYIGDKEIHKYGLGPFCKFSISTKWVGVMGVYALFLNEELMYIGQCEDFGKRYNQGYGQISPRNCFVGGQSTNCKINKFIFDSTRKGEIIKLYFLETNSYDKIESELIELYKPILNHQKGKNINKNIPKNKEKTENKIENAKIQKQCGVDDVYNYLINLVDEAKNNNLEYLEIISGNIHRELNLSERMPTVCNAMYKLKKDDDEIIFSPPKGRGSKLHIRYFL